MRYVVQNYLTPKGYCLWCFFKHSEHPNFNHCKKMIDRALSRTRKDDNCHHCGHSKKEHDGKSYIEENGKMVLELKTQCNHYKQGKDPEDYDSYCECRGYL